MIRKKILFLLIISVIFSACTDKAEKLHEKDEIITTVNNVGGYADQRDWVNLKKILSDKVEIDYTSMAGGKPETLSPDTIINRWKFLEGFDRTQHFVTNHQVKIMGDKAEVESYVMAVHYIKGYQSWVVYGTYNHKLTKTDNKWRVNHLKFNLSYSEGNLKLPEVAFKRRK